MRIKLQSGNLKAIDFTTSIKRSTPFSKTNLPTNKISFFFEGNVFSFPDWSFVLIGSSKLGENDNVNSYAYKIAEKFKAIGAQAKFHGFKNHDFVQEKMKNGSIIIIPSLWEEPFGLVVAEAMSNGLAIIASKVGGIPEIVEQNGILIDDINHKKLEETIIDLINNRDKREMLQKKAWDNFKLSSSRSSKKLDNFRKIIFQNHF